MTLIRTLANVLGRSSRANQELTWKSIVRSVQAVLNKATSSNTGLLLEEILKLNLARVAGPFSKAVIKSVIEFPALTDVFSAIVAAVDNLYPETGDLVSRRLYSKMHLAFVEEDYDVLLTTSKFISQLMHRGVLSHLIALSFMRHLISRNSNDDIIVCCEMLVNCGALLLSVAPCETKNILFVLARTGLRMYLANSGTSEAAIIHSMVVLQFSLSRFKGLPKFDSRLEDFSSRSFHLFNTANYGVDEQLDIFSMDPQFLSNDDAFKDRLLERQYQRRSKQDLLEKLDSLVDFSVSSTDTSMRGIISHIWRFTKNQIPLPCILLPGRQVEICRTVIQHLFSETFFHVSYADLGQILCSSNSGEEYRNHFRTEFSDFCSRADEYNRRSILLMAQFLSSLLTRGSVDYIILADLNISAPVSNPSQLLFGTYLYESLADSNGLDVLSKELLILRRRGVINRVFPNPIFGSLFLGRAGLRLLAERVFQV